MKTLRATLDFKIASTMFRPDEACAKEFRIRRWRPAPVWLFSNFSAAYLWPNCVSRELAISALHP
jgi:hypothetical protein